MSARHFFLVGVAALLGCATAASNTAARSNAKVITEQEIATSGVTNAYEAVQRLRPSFLRARGPVSMRSSNTGLPVVYQNGLRYGDIASLRMMPIVQVSEIRFYNAAEANTKFGIDTPNGIIDVKMRGT